MYQYCRPHSAPCITVDAVLKKNFRNLNGYIMCELKIIANFVRFIRESVREAPACEPPKDVKTIDIKKITLFSEIKSL